jgi:predicted unusual protein kinase regulating ubiquinone biosynthesis (AarF/ABC1/UbiB family)
MNDATASTVPMGHSQSMSSDQAKDAPFDLGRYLRVVRFFAGAFATMIFWDVILSHLLGKKFVERSATRRWQRLARNFRALAVELGGVLIKLGQFLSVRVDVLPQQVTAELAGLQDEVAPERLADIQAVIAAEFGQPVDRVFPWFAPQPEAAASLAQVHRARLLTGEEVVVKVQRPRIEEIVETDLRAVRTGIGWLKRFRLIGRRVDLDLLYAEFSQTTRNELDFIAEANNAERFALNFADNPIVRIPKVYAQSSTRRVLIMENVASIKIGDMQAIEAAGISRQEVARCLFDIYLKMVFEDNFVHADPHPGNLFVQPLPPLVSQLGLVTPAQGRPFRLVFVDFGMVATIPERVRPALREFLVGFITRDASRVVHAYQGAGVLLPGADLARLEQIEAELLERYAGLTLREAQQRAMSEWEGLAREYRDIIYEMPFQFPSDLLFVGRAIAILFGISTSLDPDFDPWKAVEPFAKEMASEEVKRDWRVYLGELQKLVQLVFSLPGQADRFFGQAARGELTVRTTWSPENTRTLRRVEASVNRLTGAVIFAALLLAAVAIYVTQGGWVSYLFFGLAAVAFLVTLFRR